MNVGLVVALAAGLAACGTTGPVAANAEGGGLRLFGSGKPPAKAASEIGVNSYLWRAALDVVKFMPLASADPYGGVVITDWYADPAKPDESNCTGTEAYRSAKSAANFRNKRGISS
jgi:hypothetical protein